MSYTVSIDTVQRVVRVVVTGRFDAEEAPRMTTDARKAAAECGFNVLYDIRQGIAGKLENSDIFWWPRNIPALKEAKAPRVRVASLFVEPQRPIVEFWETAFRNVGLSARAFLVEGDAIAWLRGQTT